MVRPLSSENEAKPAQRKKSFKNKLHQWLRWIHIYTSMISLLVVLFFALTGITLNHPEWTFGGREVQTKYQGTLKPESVVDGKVQWLAVVEQLRAEHPVRGAAADMRVDGDEGSLSFKAPGNTSDCFFNIKNREYDLSITAQGLVGVMNDLHRGRDSGSAWAWVVDVSGVFLTVISLTGLGILFYLKKSRVAGFSLAAAGIIVIAVLAYLASK